MRVFLNDDTTASFLARSGVEGTLVLWKDPLASGKLTAHWSLDDFSRARAALHRELCWDSDGEFEADLRLRNQDLAEAVDEPSESLFVFGPGLEDQLQLCQIVAWIAMHAPAALDAARFAVSDRPIAVLSGEEILTLAGSGRPLDFAEADAYRNAWLAAVSPDPRFLERAAAGLAGDGLAGILKGALGRLLREYPSAENGLSLTECQVLDAIELGAAGPKELYAACREAEAAPFLNDWEFWLVLERLCSGLEPLVSVREAYEFLRPPKDLAWTDFQEQRLVLTAFGKRVLSGEERASLDGLGPRWIGGVEVGAANPWYWDYEDGGLTRAVRELVSR